MTRHSASSISKSNALQNIGPKSRAILAAAGITSLSRLQELEAVAAFVRAKSVSPSVTLNLLWAPEGANLDAPWQEVARSHRTSLLLALEDYELHRQG